MKTWRKDGTVEGHELIFPYETPKSQMTAEQPSTRKTLKPTKKEILHPKTKSHKEMVEGVQL